MKIKHIVLLKFKQDTSEAQIENLMNDLANLKLELSGIEEFSWGKYNSHEGLNQGFTHGFEMLFTNSHYRDDYLTHPKHCKIAYSIHQHLEKNKEKAPALVAFDYIYKKWS